jgi:HEAT repeat protein
MNANAGEAARVRAVRALGSLSDKETAQFLVQLVQGDDPRIGQPVSEAAADALTELTGQESIGRDAGLWAQWWQQQANKTPEQFMADRRAEREGSARQLAVRVREMTAAIAKDVTDTHRLIADPREREANILARLKNPLPEYRAAGAQLVNFEQINGRTVGQPVKDRLLELIADSSPDVRRSVAGAFAAINDPKAAPLLLAQLRRERIPANRLALLTALTPTRDVAAVPDLIAALADPSFQVAEEAAKALAEVGPEVAKNPASSGQVAQALVVALDRTRKRGATQLREQIVYAMVPLKNPDLINPLIKLLPPDAELTSPGLRTAAARALGQMTVRKETQDKIAQALAASLDPRHERERAVRLEAAQALGLVGGPGQAGILLNSMNPANEPDPETREGAWKSLTNLFDQLDPIVLQGYANNFRNEPARQLPVYLTLNKKYVEKNLPNDMAATREEIAKLYMDPQIDKPDKAVEYFKLALAHWDAVPGATKVGLETGLLESYLRSKQVKEGIEFARVRIQRNRTAADSLGRAILREVDRLERAKDLKGAAELLAEAKTLQIGGSIGDSIDEKDKDIRSKIVPFNDHLADDWRGIFA